MIYKRHRECQPPLRISVCPTLRSLSSTEIHELSLRSTFARAPPPPPPRRAAGHVRATWIALRFIAATRCDRAAPWRLCSGRPRRRCAAKRRKSPQHSTQPSDRNTARTLMGPHLHPRPLSQVGQLAMGRAPFKMTGVRLALPVGTCKASSALTSSSINSEWDWIPWYPGVLPSA